MGPRVQYARVAVAPILPSDASVASYGLVIDRVRLIVVRPAADTLADTTVVLPPDSSALDLDLRVPLLAASETLQVSIIALSGSVPLFQGTSPVEVRTGGTPPAPTEIPVLTYVGPGAGVDSLVVSPGAPFIYLNDSLRFQVQAFQGGAPVPQFYVAWSTSDSTVARITGDGTLHAPNARTSVRVIARTPGGVAADSTTVTFVPLPTQLLVVSGGSQSGVPGQPLAEPLEVEVRAADNLPVGGVAVRFRSLSGGSPVDTLVTSDANGRARVTAVLGLTQGIQAVQVLLAAFPGITTAFTMTAAATAPSPATSIITVASGSVVSGGTVTLRMQGKDASGADITTGGAVVVFTRSGGVSTGSIGATADSGNGVYTAVFTGVLAGSATTIGATINGAPVTSALPTITVSPGPISTARSVVTASSDSVIAGDSIVLRLQAKDNAGNLLTTGGATVIFVFDAGPSTGTASATADSGNGVYTAMLTGIVAGSPSPVSTFVGSLTVTTPRPLVRVVRGPAAQVAFLSPIAGSVAGNPIAPAIEVYVRDRVGNVALSYTGDVTIGIGANPGGATLSGTLTRAAVAGVASFADLVVDLPASGYTLVASSAGLASDTTVPFGVLAAPATVYWTNPSGGNWSTAGNWSSGAVPGPTETATIALPGSYTVTLDINDTIAGLQLGGTSGTQTLLAASRTLLVSSQTQIDTNGILDLRASTLDGVLLTNAGTVLVTGSSTIGPAIATTGTSLIRVQGNNVYGQSTLTVTNSFTNNGAVVLTDTTATYGAALTLPAGETLTNGPSGTLEAAVGALGTRTLTAALDNQGTVTLNRPLTINRAGAVHANSGTIDVVAGDLTLSQTGVSPSFTTSGTIAIAAGRTFAVSGGAFDYSAGTITGAGTLSLSSTSLTLTPNLSTGSVGISLTSSTVGGTGTLDVATGTELAVRASTINGPFANHGLVTFTGSSTMNGTIVNDGSAMLRVQGNNVYGQAFLTAANSFTNDGAIVLTDTTSTYGATLTVTAGATLTNAGTIDAATGAAGSRTLTAALDNQGTVTLNRPLAINRVSAVHSNSGTIDVTGGDLTLSQSGGGASFTMVGSGAAVNVAPGRTFAINGGALNYDAGSISGGGTLVITSTAVTSTQGFNTATAALSLISSTWGGAGALTVSPGTVLHVRASTISAPLVNQATIQVTGSSAFNGGFTNPSGATVRILGNNVYGQAFLTVGTSFTNGGAITLTDTTSSYGATLTMPAGTTLTNAAGATIDAAAGFAGSRTLTVELDNQGTVTLNRPLLLNRTSAAHQNSGTIAVSGGDFTLSQTGIAPSFTSSGSILIGSGRTFAVTGGAFNYAAGAITGGTMSLSSTTVTAAQNFNTATAGLSIVSSSWGGAGTLTVDGATTLLLRASTVSSPLVNAGLLVASGSSFINGTLSNDSAATLRVQGDGTYGQAFLTIANGFTNDGAIALTDTASSYGATLIMPVGQTLTNATGGTISALPGFNGSRTLTAQIDNYGLLTVATASTQGLTINRSGAQHQNRGTLAVSGGDLIVSQSGVSPSFRNTGAISVAAGDTLHVSGGSFVHDSGTIGGAGALTLTNLSGSAAFNIAHSIASLHVTSSTASFATAQSTGSTGFFFSSAVVNGPGLLTNSAGQFLNVRASTINADLVNRGTLLVNGGSNFTGALTTDTSSRIRVQGNGTYGHGTLTVSNAFTNNGTIELTDTASSYGATLNGAGGTLTNSPTGTIAAVLGAGGSRTLAAQLDNQGLLSVALAPNGLLTLGRSGAVHLNSGVIDIGGGDVTLGQSVGGSLTNTGTISVAAGDTLTINNGALAHNGGTFGGAGTLVLFGVNTGAFNVAQTFASMIVTNSTVAFATPQSTAATSFDFTGTFVDGPAPFTNDAGEVLPLHSAVVRTALHNAGTILTTGGTSFTTDTLTTAAGSLIRIQGNPAYGSSNLTVTKGFENAGTVELTDTVSTYGATLTVPNGTLVNLAGAFLNAVTGGNGSRTLTATIDNLGTLLVATSAGQSLAVIKTSAAHQNRGIVRIASGALSITGAGSSLTNTTSGVVEGSGVLSMPLLTFTNQGTVKPGVAGTAVLKLVGNYVQALTGTLDIELGGLTPGTQYDRLVDSAGAVNLGGALNVSLVNGFAPALGDTFSVLAFPSRSGSLSSVSLPSLGGGLILDTIGTATALRLVVVPQPRVATRLGFLQQPPSSTFFGDSFAVQVAAFDDSGNIVTTFTGDVALGENPLSTNSVSKLQGTLTRAAISGVATFTDLRVDGTDTTALDAISGALLPATSSTVAVVDQIVLTEGDGVGRGAYFAGVDTVRDRVYVSNTSGNSASVIDATNHKVVDVPVLGANPGWEGINLPAKQVYVSDFVEGSVYLLDATGLGVLGTIPVGAGPTQPVVNASGDTMYVPARSGVLSLVSVDVVRREVVGAVPIGRDNDNAAGAVLDPVNGLIWVVIETQNSIKSIDPQQGRVVDSIFVGEVPYGIAVDPVLKRLYVTLSGQAQIYVLDLNTKAPLPPIGVGPTPQGISVDVETGRVFVANYDDGVKPGTISIIDGTKGELIKTIVVGVGAGDAEYNPRNRLVYVPNGVDNSVSIVKPQ
jgi:fibronectin-binding autotransporter adhesin